MKGRLNSILWWAIAINAFVLCAVLGLAYGAGARSGGLRLYDFTILPPLAGFELLGAAFLIVATTIFLFVWFENKVQKRVADLIDYSERLDNGDYEAHANVTSDDFGLLSESFNRASEKLARISQVEAIREAVELEIADLEGSLAQLGRGELDLSLSLSLSGDGGASRSVSPSIACSQCSSSMRRPRAAQTLQASVSLNVDAWGSQLSRWPDPFQAARRP